MSYPIPSIGGKPLSPKEQDELDAPLIALATRSNGDLRKLLFAFFSFLHRRTDFYMVPHEDDTDSKMGFREGDAEKVLLAAFRQFPLRKLPPSPLVMASTASEGRIAKDNQNEATSKQEENRTISTKKSKEKSQDSEIRYTDEGLQIPVGNGGTTKRYRWTQTLDECTVLISVGDYKAKQLDVSMSATSIAVKSKKVGGNQQNVFVEGELSGKIDPSESSWTLEGGVLVLVLYKHTKSFWETVLKGDERIDTTQVDSRRHIDEYDESTQAQIRKIIHDQSQVTRGLPTSPAIPGSRQEIPPLPDSVEYIDRGTLDRVGNGKDAK